MKDRRLLKGLRSVASSLDPGVSEKADSFSLLQSIAAKCGLSLDDDGLVSVCKQKKARRDISAVISLFLPPCYRLVPNPQAQHT